MHCCRLSRRWTLAVPTAVVTTVHSVKQSKQQCERHNLPVQILHRLQLMRTQADQTGL